MATETEHGTVTKNPVLYDLHFYAQPAEIQMYLELSKGVDILLECGIGTGRTAIPLAQNGKVIFGIDNSDEMLSRFRSKLQHLPAETRANIHLFSADMRDFTLRRKFDFIYVPFMTFNYLMTIADQLSFLSTVQKHLSNEGILVLELMTYATLPFWLANDMLPRLVFERLDEATDRRVEMWRTTRFNSATQEIEQHRRYRFFSPEGEFLSERLVLWRNRFILFGELQLLLSASRFRLDAVYGDHSFRPYTHDSPVLVVVARPETSQ